MSAGLSKPMPLQQKLTDPSTNSRAFKHTLWEHFLYPANLDQINATDTSCLRLLIMYVTADLIIQVQGRVDITRTFDGHELNKYIFGLFSDPDHLSLVGIPVSYNITQFAANQNISSATTVFMLNATSFNTLVPVTPSTHGYSTTLMAKLPSMMPHFDGSTGS
ncbi:hypothetical protein BDW59DRAFT_166910 [Aspergillus cavernicola]|uniref:Uncharacterized protein n=1 Tax=Aspergillus cavernicola TaxID=176166 RepID=A0ABR4HHT9_9EURO